MSPLVGAFCMGRHAVAWATLSRMGHTVVNGAAWAAWGCMGCMEPHELQGAAWSCKQVHELHGAAWSCMQMQ
eukprot:351665-Chlamydomonas_euryale.AAC.1